MGVYEPLTRYLASQSGREMPVTFTQLETILGRKLPNSAYKHEEFWTNNPTGHVHAKAWRSAGWKTRNINLTARTVIFVRDRDTVAERLGRADVHRRAGPDLSGHNIVAMIRRDRDR